MKITKNASGKQEVRMSKSEWEAIGKKAQWAIPVNQQGVSPMSGIDTRQQPQQVAYQQSTQQERPPSYDEAMDALNKLNAALVGLGSEVPESSQAMTGFQNQIQVMVQQIQTLVMP